MLYLRHCNPDVTDLHIVKWSSFRIGSQYARDGRAEVAKELHITRRFKSNLVTYQIVLNSVQRLEITCVLRIESSLLANSTYGEEPTMDWSAIADWMTILFFLWYGLKTFIPALNKGSAPMIGGIIALAVAISIFMDRSP